MLNSHNNKFFTRCRICIISVCHCIKRKAIRVFSEICVDNDPSINDKIDKNVNKYIDSSKNQESNNKIKDTSCRKLRKTVCNNTSPNPLFLPGDNLNETDNEWLSINISDNITHIKQTVI